MIELKNIELSFSDNKIFENFSLKINKNENICLSGKSGKGKSTLLKLIQGYVIPNEGEIIIKDISLNTNTINQIRETIIWIPQNINLPVSNGLELMELLDISSKHETVLNFIERLDLETDIISKDFSKISGGQKQRIIVAICLSIDKEIILMDEPTSSLDENSICLLIKLINSLENKTIISASHNQTWLNNANKIINL